MIAFWWSLALGPIRDRSSFHSAARPQPKRDSPCPPCRSSFNTEHTERLSDLRVEAVLGREDTEALTTRGEILAAREEAECYCYRWFVFAVSATLLFLSARPGEASNFLGGLVSAQTKASQTVHAAPRLIQQFGASSQENRAAGLPGDSENIRWANRFPGSDLGAQINAANSDLGKEAGEIWVGRPGTVETRVSLSSNHVLRLLAPTIWKAGILVQNGNSVFGNGCASLLTLAFQGPGPFIVGSNISNLKVADLCAEAPPESNGYVLVRVFGSRGIEVTGCQARNVRLFYSAAEGGYEGASESNSSHDIKVIGNTAVSARNDAATGAAVAFAFTRGAVASDNIIRGFQSGFQWWGGDANPQKGNGAAANERKVRNLSFVNNTISDVAGGIWGGMGEGIVASGNVIERCSDICLDSEGNNAVVFSNNYVKDGANGAIATFFYNREVLITGNTVVSSSAKNPLLRTYTGRQEYAYDRDVQVIGNHFTCLDTSPCVINSVSGLPERFVFKDNTLRNVSVDLSDFNFKHIVVISGNDFLFDVPSSKPFGAIRVAHTYSMASGAVGMCEISNNTVRSNVQQPPGSRAIGVFQDDPTIAPLTIIEGNRLVGVHPFPTDIAVGGGSKNPSVMPLFLIRNNLMGAGSFSRLDQANPRSIVKLGGNFRIDSAPFPGEASSADK